MSSTSSKRQPKTDPATQPGVIASINAAAVGRVYPFAAVQDIRYYLNGVALIPGPAPVIAATNGHMLYIEEDEDGTVNEQVILRLSKRASFFLKRANQVIVSRGAGGEGIATIVDSFTHEVLYVEPGNCLIDGRYPDIGDPIGKPAQWVKGLVGEFNAGYLQQALALPGSVEFYHKDVEDPGKSAMLFTVSIRGGGKGLGCIMPMSAQHTLEAYFPVALQVESTPKATKLPDRPAQVEQAEAAEA